jgi:hypothetical protein
MVVRALSRYVGFLYLQASQAPETYVNLQTRTYNKLKVAGLESVLRIKFIHGT